MNYFFIIFIIFLLLLFFYYYYYYYSLPFISFSLPLLFFFIILFHSFLSLSLLFFIFFLSCMFSDTFFLLAEMIAFFIFMAKKNLLAEVIPQSSRFVRIKSWHPLNKKKIKKKQKRGRKYQVYFHTFAILQVRLSWLWKIYTGCCLQFFFCIVLSFKWCVSVCTLNQKKCRNLQMEMLLFTLGCCPHLCHIHNVLAVACSEQCK